ncbi:MAG: hypothetical protein JXM71_11935 [Spirochaetales bacterium]|nr:hypothetical protein [Spirochaetales bacterium]
MVVRARVGGIAPVILVVVACCALAAVAGAQGSIDEYTLRPSEATRALLSMPEDPGAVDLMSAAIAFSGADTTRASAALALGSMAMEEARVLADAAGDSVDEYALGSLVLDLAHRYLREYVELESRMDSALLDGRYNCVSSATLYLILARAAGLSVGGIAQDDHAYCYLVIDGKRVHVETTSAFGFDDTTKPEPDGGSAGTYLSARGVVALVLRNRATLLERAGRYAEALSLVVDAFAWAPADAFTRQSLEGRVSNCVSDIRAKGRYADAVTFIDEAIALYGPDEGFNELRRLSIEAMMAERLQSTPPDLMLAAVDEAAEQGVVGVAWREWAYTFAYVARADQLRGTGDHLGAWRVAAEGSSRFPGSASLAELARVARSNWVKASHNHFATLYNAGDYAAALALVEEALVIAPRERLLLQDEAAVRKLVEAEPGSSP